MEIRYKVIGYVDCEMIRKWNMTEKKWQGGENPEALISYMKRYCKIEDGEVADFLTGEIVHEDKSYVIEYNDMIIDKLKLYEKTTN